MTGYASIDRPWLKYFANTPITQALPACSMYEYLWQNNKDHLDDIALIYFDKQITYRKLFDMINELAASLCSVGIQQGSTVTICAITTPETIATIYAANLIGALCNIIEPRTNTDSIVARINDADTQVLFIQDVFYSKISGSKYKADYTVVLSLSDSMPTMKKTFFRYTIGKKIPLPQFGNQILQYAEFVTKNKNSTIVKATYQVQQPAAIIYTGGTTGLPKGAILTNDSINSVAYHFLDHNLCPRQTRYLDIMPPFIAYGLVCGIHMPLCFGWKVIVIAKFEPSKFADYIIKYKPNFFLGVPSHYEFLLKSKKLSKMDLSFIQVAAMGGDALNSELEKKINKFLSDHNATPFVYKGYGMTEVSSAIVSTLGCPGGSKFASLGVPFKNNIVAIFEPGTENELKYGVQGEIYVSSPSMMLGYYKNESETKNIFSTHKDGSVWIHTKDIGYMDEDGHLYFVDRIKRMIVRPDGHNVWPSRIENIIGGHEDVSDCAVIGAKNTTGSNGQIPTAFIVIRNHSKSNDEIEAEIHSMCLEKLPERDVAQRYIFIEKLPLTLVGKVDYRELENIANQS